MMSPEPGSVARAFLAWRATASAMLVVWLPMPFIAPSFPRSNDGFQDLAALLLVIFAYAAGVVAVIPAFAFTLGRWLDRRTAPRGLGHSVLIFSLYGLGFGILLAMVLGVSGLNPVGILALVAAPLLTAVAGRLLIELKGRVWFFVLWGMFAIAITIALAMVMSVVLSGFGR
jgi:hypothetical protein